MIVPFPFNRDFFFLAEQPAPPTVFLRARDLILFWWLLRLQELFKLLLESLQIRRYL